MYKIVITMGDPSGIGAEIAVKALGDRKIYQKCIPVVAGDLCVMEDAIKITKSRLEINVIQTPEEARGMYGTIDLLDAGLIKEGGWEYKKVCKASGEASFQYIITAIKLALKGQVDAVVTGPINKEAVNLAGHPYSGHTQIFADYTDTAAYGMLLTSDKLRVIHVTTHMSMREACDLIGNHPERVEETIMLAHEAMLLLGIPHPRIGVAGLNAHCSEHGMFGDEEERSIIPAVNKKAAEGVHVEGPIPPDTVFVKAIAGKYDVVVAMYHDQGHIPLKLGGFRMNPDTGEYTAMSGVNATIGLPIIRTSVDHGTAYGKAGEGRANPESLTEAIDMAVRMAENKSLQRQGI